jgi:membrane-bound inhibitor of C-type lysozyme
MTNCPTTAGQSVTFAITVTNGSTAYLPSSITINGTATAASGLPANGALYNNITFWWQGGSAPTSANASTLDAYTFTVICTSAGPYYTVLASQVKY